MAPPLTPDHACPVPFDVVHQEASPRQRKIVASLCALVGVSAMVATQVGSVKLAAMPHVSGIYGASAAMIYFATFWLLMSAPRPSKPLRIIAAAYLFAGLMAVLHVLSFPGALLPGQALLGQGNAVSWLFIAWRNGFPLFIVWAVLNEPSRRHDGTPDGMNPLLIALIAVAVSAVLAFSADDVPALVPGPAGLQFSPFSTLGASIGGLACALALALIVQRRLAGRSLYLWMVLVLLAEATGVWLSTRSGGRYTVAWYGARAEGLMASAIVLALLAAHYREVQARLDTLVAELSRRTDALQAEMQHRERAERMAAQSQKLEAVGQLAAGLAHDINNFLQVIAVRAEILKRKLGAAAEADVEVVQRNVRKTEHLTRQLLSFAGRRQLQPQRVSLPEHVPEFVAFFRSVLGPGVTVQMTLAPDTWPVRLDPTELETALANLLSNARDAMNGDGLLALRSFNRRGTHGDDRAVLEITDHGSGIPPEVQERVFEPFFTTKAPGKGNGLGLSQVYAFAKACGASVQLLSEVGVGTTVRLEFPRDTTDDASAATAPSSELALTGRLVLLVDDNHDVLEATSGLLSLSGLVVRTAGGLEEAWSLLQGGLKPDWVISDIVMAGTADGVELARRLRQADPTLPVILASAYSAAAAEATAQGFIVLRKPYDAQQLLGLLRRPA
jgi:signal transduction histidine kinase/CheY-like chemotaxis protein